MIKLKMHIKVTTKKSMIFFLLNLLSVSIFGIGMGLNKSALPVLLQQSLKKVSVWMNANPLLNRKSVVKILES